MIAQSLISKPLFNISNVGGGCINQCFKVENSEQVYFVKVNSITKFPKMFDKEAKGLNLLRESKALSIPNEILQFEEGGFSFLVLEWIEKGSLQKDSYFQFGKALAEMHQFSNENFG